MRPRPDFRGAIMDTTPTSATDPATTTPAAASAGASAGAVAGSGRLRNGELRRQVAAFLDAYPGSHTAGQIARGLSGRSAGAVANALTILVGHGYAALAATAPARYTATPTPAPAATTAATGATGATATPPAPTSPAPSAAPAGPAAPRPRRPRRAAAASTAAGAGEEAVSGPVRRPGGQLYHPRLVSGIPDVTALRKLRAAGVPALLYGPPGTGKTSVVEAAFGDLITVPGDGDTTVADLVGEYTQTPDGRYVFVHGPLVRAMREGRPLFIDDATLIPPTVLAVAYPAMDGRRQITVKANG